MAQLKIIFMGTAELSCASLEKISADKNFQLLAVVTQPDKPRGREMKLQFSPVKILAEKLNLPVLQPLKARDEKFISELRELKPDLIVVVAYGQILPQSILDLPKFGCVNVHTSLLPKYRGASPIQSAILNGETETGVTIMKMDAGLDTGEIISQARTPILPEDNSQTLHDRLAQLGAELLIEIIPDYVAGKILNRLRAFTPWPGAFTFLQAEAKPQLLKIWKMEVAEKSGAAGEILSADKNGIVVASGKNALRILELQREGGRRLSAQEFLAGFPLKTGAKFV